MSRRDMGLAACGLFLAFFALYLKTHCASVYPDDSGETAVVAATLSIGHPPGYPLHTLAARCFHLLPLGDSIVRVNLFAAFLAALCAPLVFLFFRAASWRSGLLAAALLGLGPAFWHNALVAKGSVYMLNNALSLLCLHAAWRRHTRLFWLLLGLGLAHHYMSQLVLLPCYAWLLWRRGEARQTWQGIWLVLPGLSLYAYLIIRAAQDPPLNWHGIRTLNDLVFYLSRAQYAASELTRSPLTSLRQLVQALTYLWQEGAGAATLLAAWMLWNSRKVYDVPNVPAPTAAGPFQDPGRLERALLFGWLVPVAAVTVYLNLEPDRLEIMRPYLFPAYLCQALLAGLSLEALPGALRRAGQTALITLLLPLAALRYPSLDRSRYHFALDNARNLLQALPRGAAVFSAGDASIFPLWYLQHVRRRRLDLALVGTPVLPMNWVRRDLLRRYPDLLQPLVRGPIGAESIDRLVWGLLELNKHRRPLYFTYNKLNAGVKGWRLLPQGPAYLALPADQPDPPGASKRAEALLAAAVTRGFGERQVDARTRRLLIHDFAVHHNALGNWLEEQGDFQGALSRYEAAIRIDPESAEYFYNCGNALHRMARYAEAAVQYQKALERNPRYADAWYNLAANEFRRGRITEACQALGRLLELAPARRLELEPYLAPCHNIP